MRTLLLVMIISGLTYGVQADAFGTHLKSNFEGTLRSAGTQPISLIIIPATNSGPLQNMWEELTGESLDDTEPVRIIGQTLSYPNPMSWSKQNGIIGYELNKSSDIEIFVFDMRGIRIFHTYIKADDIGGRSGYNRVPFRLSNIGRELPTGVYKYVVMADGDVLGYSKMGVIR